MAIRRMREDLERDRCAGPGGAVVSARSAATGCPLKTAEVVLRLYQEEYSDFNV
jgi:hypothetical protein